MQSQLSSYSLAFPARTHTHTLATTINTISWRCDCEHKKSMFERSFGSYVYHIAIILYLAQRRRVYTMQTVAGCQLPHHSHHIYRWKDVFHCRGPSNLASYSSMASRPKTHFAHGSLNGLVFLFPIPGAVLYISYTFFFFSLFLALSPFLSSGNYFNAQ